MSADEPQDTDRLQLLDMTSRLCESWPLLDTTTLLDIVGLQQALLSASSAQNVCLLVTLHAGLQLLQGRIQIARFLLSALDRAALTAVACDRHHDHPLEACMVDDDHTVDILVLIRRL